jgi:hypothetical protein
LISPELRQSVGTFASKAYENGKPLISGGASIVGGTALATVGIGLAASAPAQGPLGFVGAPVGGAAAFAGVAIARDGYQEFGVGVDNVSRIGNNVIKMCTGK